LIGAPANWFEAARIRMDGAAKRNNAAKAAIESVLFDAVGKNLGVPAVQLLGGTVRESVPVLWTLASGDPAQEIEEAEKKLEARLHDTFKVKIGAQSPEADLCPPAPPRRPCQPDRRRQPGLGRDDSAALPAGPGRARRAARGAAAARLEPCRHGAAFALARPCR
jgi:L-alanine-DL-glutamate epimerase-like enolase superfamily enzyme